METLLGCSLASAQATVAWYAGTGFNSRMLPAELTARNMNSSAILYPYRDDGLRIWQAISDYVTAYLEVFYKDDEDVANDAQLMAWCTELVTAGGVAASDFGDGPAGVAPIIRTRSYLAEAATMLIFTASAQHAAVHFPQVSAWYSTRLE